MSKVYCPQTGTPGKAVDSATLKAILKTSLRDVTAQPYFFCDEKSCDIVYFTEDGSHLVKCDQLRVDVYQKSSDTGTLICYCFQHSVEDILQAVETGNASNVIDDIQQGFQQGQCACDWRNPQGTCCLGNVRQLIKKAQNGES